MTTSDQDKHKQEKHQKAMAKQKERVDAGIEAADTERGVAVLITGNGKGKSSSAFGMVMRALGYDMKVGVVQFIKGEQLSGEEIYLRDQCPQVDLYQMGTGFTWNTQDFDQDKQAAMTVWQQVLPFFSNPDCRLIVLDEITYMFKYKYLDINELIMALKNRPKHQNVIITGRGAPKELIELADTVSEIQLVKHAFNQGIKAQEGIEW